MLHEAETVLNNLFQANLFGVIRELFTAATSKEPPRGIGHSPQSRAVYGVDVILQWITGEKGKFSRLLPSLPERSLRVLHFGVYVCP